MNTKNKVRWGVIGTAGVARSMSLPGMVKAANAEIVGIAGRNQEKILAFQKKFGIPKSYMSYEHLLEDDEIDAVYIPLPIELHKKWTMLAADHGKHVLCEKPLASSEQDAREMFEYCEKRGVLLMEAIPYLNSPLNARILEIVHSGEIGDLLSVTSTFLTLRHPSIDIRMCKKNYGGSIYDMGCYNTSLALTLMGEAPESVSAASSMTDQNIDDTAVILMDFNTPLHRRAFSVSGMALGDGQVVMCYMIGGASGRIEVPEKGFNQEGNITIQIVKNNEIREETVYNPNNYMLEMQNFSDSILNGAPLTVTQEHSLQNAAIIDAALRAINY